MNPVTLFSSARVAEGYAKRRPYFHPLVIERVRRYTQLAAGETFARGLDIGCGAGLSTRALRGLAAEAIGVDPFVGMLEYACVAEPECRFISAWAESLPFRDASFDVMTAAGSLNWVEWSRFMPEARRVMTSGAWLIAYDISEGRNFPGDPRLDHWYSRFLERYPKPPRRKVEAAAFGAETPQLQTAGEENWTIEMPFTAERYLGYVLTQSNVAEAIARGCTESGIAAELQPEVDALFEGRERPVQFAASSVYFRRP